MADLGTINGRVIGPSLYVLPTAWQQYHAVTCKVLSPAVSLRFDYTSDIKADMTGVLAGTVLDGTTPVPGCEVVIFSRRTKRPVFALTTDADGEFSVNTVAKDAAESTFFAVAFDPEGGEVYNALIFDRLTPV